ncbi:MAG: hypothetical protein ACR2LJ_04410 [Acidimicrobiales bacterium]
MPSSLWVVAPGVDGLRRSVFEEPHRLPPGQADRGGGGHRETIWTGTVSKPDVVLIVSVLVAFVVAGMMGVVLEATLIRRLYGRLLDTLLVTWGVSLILQQLARDIFGAPSVDVRAPQWLRGSPTLLGVSLPGRGCSSSGSSSPRSPPSGCS